MATATTTTLVNLELGQEGAGILRYYADGKRQNCPALVAVQRKVLNGAVPKKITMTLEFEGPVEEPIAADDEQLKEIAAQVAADAKAPPKPKRTRARAKATA